MLPASFGLPGYAELQCASNFTFLQGASHAEELATRAAQLAYEAIAITDECSLAGIVRAHVAAKETGIKLLVGAHFRVTNADGSPALAFTAIAQNRDGYGNLSELITLARTRTAKGTYVVYPHDLDHPDSPYTHLRALPDCLIILTPEYPAKDVRLDAQALWAAQTFGADRCWMGLTLHARALDDLHRNTVYDVAERHGLSVVATGQVLMHVRSRKPLQDTLTAIRLNRPVTECGFELTPNAEQHLRSRLRLANVYPADALAQTLNIASRCTFMLDELRYEYPDELVPPGTTPTAYLRRETYLGAQRRYPRGIPHSVQTQIEHELSLIADLKYEPYFLTVYDIVRFERGNPLSGPRIGGQFRSLLLPGRHRG
jgi:error-prone DNA polymerase